MVTYKEKMQMRVNGMALAAAAAALIYLVLTFNRERLPELPSFIKGFHIGAFIGFELFAVVYISKYMRIRKNEEEIKKLYIEENDERTALILGKASMLGMSVLFIGLVLAAIVSGFFSAAVFVAFVGTLAFVFILFAVLWVYFSKKL